MTTTPIAADPNDVTVRTRFEQWYLRELRGNPANLELEESGEYKYLPTLFLAFEAGEKVEREACAEIAEQETRLSRTSLSNILGDDGVSHCHVAAAIRARSNVQSKWRAACGTSKRLKGAV